MRVGKIPSLAPFEHQIGSLAILSEYLEGRTPKENTLSFFKRNFIPAKSETQEAFSFGVAERSEAVAGRSSSV